MHIHNIIGVGNLDAVRQIFDAVFLQHIQNLRAATHQNNLCIKILYCLQSAQNRCFRCVVTAHCIKYDLHLRHLFLLVSAFR